MAGYTGNPAFAEYFVEASNTTLYKNTTDFGSVTLDLENTSWTTVSALPVTLTPDSADSEVHQVLISFDAVHTVEQNFPDFFGDVFTEDEKRAKLQTRLTRISILPSGLVTDTTNCDIVLNSSVSQNNNLVLSRPALNTSIQTSSDAGQYVYPDGSIRVSVLAYDTTTVTGKSNVFLYFDYSPKEDANPRTFSLNGVKQPWYVGVQKVNYDALPPIVSNYQQTGRGATNYFYKQSADVRYISMDIFIIADKPELLRGRVRQLASYLNHPDEDMLLRFSDDPDYVWKVRLDGSTSIEEALHVGAGTLTFMCVQNSAEGELIERRFTNADTKPSSILVSGNAPTHPLVSITMKEDSTHLNLVGANGDVTVGTPPGDAKPKPPVNLHPMVFQSYMSANETRWTNWSSGFNGLGSQGFKYGGTFSRASDTFYMKPSNYPPKPANDDIAAYYGAANKAAMPHALLNFDMEAVLHLHHKIGDKNASNYICISMIGADGQGFISVNLEYSSLLKGQGVCRIDDGSVPDGLLRRVSNDWTDFYGKIMIQRRNGKFRWGAGEFRNAKQYEVKDGYFYGTSALRSTWWSPWINLPPDSSMNTKATEIGIVIARSKWKKNQCNSAKIANIRVWEVLDPPDTSTPPLHLVKDDVVDIDMQSGQIYLNGQLKPALLDPTSDFFPLIPGYNNLVVTPANVDMTVQYHNRVF
ncbi:hypothetical protein FK481_0016 [Listeria phage LP-010]|uniref:Tail protein n=1 Tax=Listeria phage LP-010 TaxID=2590046 RepID=A0A514U6M2_9CAUD|nr:hypothetical protein FK481_0016 [Listeria phage LP-010]